MPVLPPTSQASGGNRLKINHGLGVFDVPDHRKHRGPHPEDKQLFAADHWPRLRAATGDLSWLLTAGYASRSALKLVGDRYALDARQRVAVARCACADQAVVRRTRHQVSATDLPGHGLWIDAYNVLTSLESALSSGVILHGRDGCYRDMASMHGSYRKVAETIPAIQILGELITDWNVKECRWLLDQPVSNSGRLKAIMRDVAAERGWNWQVELVRDPDYVLRHTDQIVATSDSQILDQAERWFNLAEVAIDLQVANAWIVDLSE